MTRKGMKKAEFRPGDLSEKAYEEYSGSSFEFYQGKDGLYYIEGIGFEKVGTINDVEEFLISFQDE